MRFHDPLDDILGNRIQVKILRVLVRTKGSFTGRELARLINHSQNQTSLALKELERNGLVVWQGAGRSHLYSIDRDNIVNTFLEEAFKFEDSLQEIFADLFFGKVGKDLLSIVLFGSVAKGNERPESDIDLVLVVKDKANLKVIEERAAEASMLVTRQFGNQAMPVIVTASDYDGKMKSKKGFWREIAETGRKIYPNRGD